MLLLLYCLALNDKIPLYNYIKKKKMLNKMNKREVHQMNSHFERNLVWNSQIFPK